MRRWHLHTVTLLLLTLALAACPARTRLTEIEPEPPLRVGITPTTPPMIFKQGEEIVGVEADFARALARGLGRTLRFVEIPWEGQVTALLDRRTDIIMSGMTITVGRRVRIAFSEPYLSSGLLAMTHRRNKKKFNTVKKILDTSDDVGVRRGTTSEQFVEDMMRDARPITYLSHKDAMLDLRRSRIEIFIDDAPMIAWLVSENEAEFAVHRESLKREPLGWGMRQSDTMLRGAVDEMLALWKRDGTVEQIIRRWMPFYPGLQENRQGEDSYSGG